MKIAPIILEHIYRTGNVIERTQVLKGLPEDAVIKHACYMVGKDALHFVVWSETFEEVPVGVEPPEMEPILLKRLE